MDAQTQTGDTALAYACENGHTDVAEVLLYYNADLEHESEGGRTPLMKACRAGHICTVKFLISKGADVNRQTTNNDHTPLSLACAGGHQAVVELLLKNGADPFHKLKDNSTMLIEAAKGGHIGVVQLLLDYPHSMGNNALVLGGGVNSAQAVNNALAQTQQQLQQQTYLLAQQQQQQQQSQQKGLQSQLGQQLVSQAQQQQQLLNAPPGLHEVPEAVRVSNQQIFHQQQLQPSKDNNNLDQQQQMQQQPQIISNTQVVATSTGNIILDSNTVRQAGVVSGGAQPESILTQMRLLQMQHGFTDGLAHGLARAQPSVVNQLVNQAAAAAASLPSASSSSGGVAAAPGTAAGSNVVMTGKQSLLRHKNRQIPSAFEPNLTTSEAQQVRTQPVGEDELTKKNIAIMKLLKKYNQKVG